MAMEQANFEAILAGFGEGWRWEKGSWWLVCADGYDVRKLTKSMLALNARFVAITAMEREDKEIRLDYQWDLDGQLLSFITSTVKSRMAAIVDLCPAADWVERETHEYFAVEFMGRDNTMPLMTRPGDPVGINLRKEEAAQ